MKRVCVTKRVAARARRPAALPLMRVPLITGLPTRNAGVSDDPRRFIQAPDPLKQASRPEASHHRRPERRRSDIGPWSVASQVARGLPHGSRFRRVRSRPGPSTSRANQSSYSTILSIAWRASACASVPRSLAMRVTLACRSGDRVTSMIGVYPTEGGVQPRRVPFTRGRAIRLGVNNL